MVGHAAFAQPTQTVRSFRLAGVAASLRAHEPGIECKTPDEWKTQVNSRGLLESAVFSVNGQRWKVRVHLRQVRGRNRIAHQLGGALGRCSRGNKGRR